MKKSIGAYLLFILSTALVAQQMPTMIYEVDVTQNLDTFYVSLDLDGKLDKSASIFQFASTAPGTYQTMNIGRFVSDFRALDNNGKELSVSQKSVNQFLIEKPQKLARVTYRIAETFDTEVDEYPVYLMCGSSNESDHALINAHTVMGYFEGYQKSPLKIMIKGSEDWKSGTALEKSGEYYMADDFDHAVDSPILMGKLTYANTKIAETEVEIFTYSQNDKLDSEALLADMSDMLEATKRYLVNLPVNRYTFLYHFEPSPPGVTGAWEHSYSSEYVMPENDPTPAYMRQLTDIASHEFFHIVTPLNIHSEVVESFNFVTPTPSLHLWMYEGVTEWASNILLFRARVIDEKDYLKNAVSQKIVVDERYFNTSWSLKKISDESFNGGEAAKQYGNIYYRGSLVAGLLDIKLLELSDGKSGLRDLMLALVEKYGKGNPISEKTFFDDLAEMTYPEILPFFNSYILEANPLPHEEYLSKIGLELKREESGAITVTKMEEMTPQQQKLYDAWSREL